MCCVEFLVAGVMGQKRTLCLEICDDSAFIRNNTIHLNANNVIIYFRNVRSVLFR